jgi:hypothetical protein
MIRKKLMALMLVHRHSSALLRSHNATRNIVHIDEGRMAEQ